MPPVISYIEVHRSPENEDKDVSPKKDLKDYKEGRFGSDENPSDEEFPSFFSESDYNFYNILTVLNTMYNEDPKIIARCLIDTLNSSEMMEISDEELRHVRMIGQNGDA